MNEKYLCQPKNWKTARDQRTLRRRITTAENHQRQKARYVASLATQRANLLTQPSSYSINMMLHTIDLQIDSKQVEYKELGQKLNVLRGYRNV